MSGSMFLSGGWLAAPDICNTGAGGNRLSGAVRQRRNPRRGAPAGRIAARGIVATLLAAAGLRSRFQQVDYRSFRELLDCSISGAVRTWGGSTYLYDSNNRLVAIKHAARFEANGRATPTRYFICRPA
jgi:hypothetical protein